MCGIAGAAWNAVEQLVSPKILERMTDVLQHRGPDGRGTYLASCPSGGGVALGHRRLAIIDVASGQQPLGNEDQTVWITFNGEIYNYRELRRDLEQRGHQFRTASDTETIIHLYEELGVRCLQLLRGMFAFALWDARQQSLLLARDRLGQKPLVYCVGDERLLFASEIKSILQVPGVRREVDADALNLYLTYGCVPQPRTMFCGIRKLPPAHFALYRRGQLAIQRYWQPDWNAETNRSVAQIQEELQAELRDSVRLRLRSDVPIGAFLSGGIDSTTIVGLMQQLLPHPVQTFTMGFPERAYDEAPFARQAAQHLGTAHRELQVAPLSARLLPSLTWHFDEPFGDSSALPAWRLAAATRAHVKVALTGDGGDELFGGYPRYRTIQRLNAFERLPSPVRRMLANSAWQLLPGSDGQRGWMPRLRYRMGILRQDADARYLHWVAVFSPTRLAGLLTPKFQAHLCEAPEERLKQALQRSGRAAGLRAMQCDLQTYLPDDLLAKVDITSMAHGLECRSPFLDHRVVELALSIPFRYQLDRSLAKPLLTRTFAEHIPTSLQRRKKMGFCVPLDTWFRGPLRGLARDMLLTGPGPDRGILCRQAVSRLLAQHSSGQWQHGERIWNLICLEQWHRDYIDSPTPPAAPPSLPIDERAEFSNSQGGRSLAALAPR
ncbi:MAG: asparagine synthase (glutamine-hydrolyzing) [Planctomycetales bacterium]|nr:asparagine synthase (glutamine-hydrolyzing) [Planctomycetales bacterium]